MIESQEKIEAMDPTHVILRSGGSRDVVDVSARGGLDVDERARESLLPSAPELFRAIYTRSAAGMSEVLAVCSATAGEGRTSIGVGLASTIAQDFPERGVLLVEADFQHSVLAKDFDVAPNPGLVECLRDGLPVQMGYRATSIENLTLLPAGGPNRGQRRLLASSRMATAVDTMRSTHDLVVLDTPPLLSNSDAIVLSDLADSIILVVRAGVTPLHQVEKAIEQLEEEKLRGVVLNAAHSATPTWLRRLLGF